MAKLVHALGCLALVGKSINELVSNASESSQLQDRHPTFTKTDKPYHLTLVTKSELRSIDISTLPDLKLVNITHVIPVGLGGNPKLGVLFLVVVWSAGQTFRKSLGLPPKQFHVTISKSDNHDIDKGLDSLLPMQFPSEPTPELLDHLAFTLHLSGDYARAKGFAILHCRSHSASEKGFLRLADAAFQLKEYKLAMLSYASTHMRAIQAKLREYALKRMVQCSKGTEWGCLFLEAEASTVPDVLLRDLLTPWNEELRSTISTVETVPTFQTEPRDGMYLPSSAMILSCKLPRFFRWIVPFHLAIMSTPRHPEDILALASPHLGIRHVLTLTEESPLEESWFSGDSITNTFLPIPNYQSPSIEQMDIILRLFQDPKNCPLLVHCGGGKGRAVSLPNFTEESCSSHLQGTVAACYLVAYGFQRPQQGLTCPTMSSTEAIDSLRAIRPGSIETSQQEAFVGKFASAIWKRQSTIPELHPEPSPSPVTIEGSIEHYDLVMLIGLPGSGKSWFSRSLQARNQQGWIHISQDDSGSRSSCETAIGYDPGKKRVLLDRCNSSADDRKQWLKLAQWATKPICVWFDYDLALCTSRAQNRVGHPTLPPGSRVRNAISQMQGIFNRPALTEGFVGIVTIRSFAASQALVLKLSPPVILFKFPRTTHLLNLGAASDDDIVSFGLPSTIAVGTKVMITEKVDGANMGFSLSSDRSIIVQNRSHYVNPTSHEQFKKLGAWIDQHRAGIYDVLDRNPHFPERYVLFGEWLAATHSIPYTNFPDRFLAFDLYDRSTRTWADRRSLENCLRGTGIQSVPLLVERTGVLPTEEELKNMVQSESRFYPGRVEGVYVKFERDGKVLSRGKVVRSDFIAGNDHWSKGVLRLNNLQLRDDEDV